MENSEEVLQLLDRFTKLKQKDIPKELDEYLSFVAKTGDTVFSWNNIRYLFREKLIHVIKDFHDSTSNIDDLPQYPNVDPFNYENLKTSLLERLELFNSAPFTIQRICELLTNPKKQYSRIDKFMRALEKNILVVSTIEPGRRQGESENGDSSDSVVVSLDVNVDIEMETENLFNIENVKQKSVNGTVSSNIHNKFEADNNKTHDGVELPTAKKQKLDDVVESEIKNNQVCEKYALGQIPKSQQEVSENDSALSFNTKIEQIKSKESETDIKSKENESSIDFSSKLESLDKLSNIEMNKKNVSNMQNELNDLNEKNISVNIKFSNERETETADNNKLFFRDNIRESTEKISITKFKNEESKHKTEKKKTTFFEQNTDTENKEIRQIEAIEHSEKEIELFSTDDVIDPSEELNILQYKTDIENAIDDKLNLKLLINNPENTSNISTKIENDLKKQSSVDFVNTQVTVKTTDNSITFKKSSVSEMPETVIETSTVLQDDIESATLQLEAKLDQTMEYPSSAVIETTLEATSCVEMKQADFHEMATDDLLSTKSFHKTELTGMEVDDINNIEAMDQ